MVASEELPLAWDVTLVDVRPDGSATLRGIDAVTAKLGPRLRGRVLETAEHGHLLATGAGFAVAISGRDEEVAYVELSSDEGAARERFTALLGNPDSSRVTRIGLLWFQALNRRDLEGARALLDDDMVLIDRRPVSAFGDVHGVEEYMARMQSLLELASDARWWPEGQSKQHGRIGSGTLLIEGHWTEGGGPMEIKYGTVYTVLNGRMAKFELFDIADRDAQDARFAELVASEEPTPRSQPTPADG
jgi:ketosteroid isomerase-like protein